MAEGRGELEVYNQWFAAADLDRCEGMVGAAPHAAGLLPLRCWPLRHRHCWHPQSAQPRCHYALRSAPVPCCLTRLPRHAILLPLPRDGVLSGLEAVQFFQRSGLPQNPTLFKASRDGGQPAVRAAGPSAGAGRARGVAARSREGAPEARHLCQQLKLLATLLALLLVLKY